jgi:serine phosphatase RsbU (regulator of sigma subunit)
VVLPKRLREGPPGLATARNYFPIRLRLLLLVSVSLAAGVGASLWTAVVSFHADKQSYVYDYGYSQVRAVSEALEGRVRNGILASRLLHAQSRQVDRATLLDLFQDTAQSFGVKRMRVFHVGRSLALEPTLQLGDPSGELIHLLDRLGWDPAQFRGRDILIGRTVTGDLAVGHFVRTDADSGDAFLMIMSSELKLPDGEAGSLELVLMDSFGETLYSHPGPPSLPPESLQDLARDVLRTPLASGARRWETDGQGWLGSYQKLALGDLLVIALVPEDDAFASLNQAVWRSLTFGAGILFTALGLSLLFIRRITGGLGRMQQITAKVSKGDFSLRLDPSDFGHDELGALATSFNSMADRIGTLMDEVGRQVEFREVEKTQSAVRTTLFPESSMDTANLGLAGQLRQARECRGDWWFHARIGDYVVLLVGKVSGEGLPAALLTATAHGAASTFVSTTRMIPKQAPLMKLLLTHLNSAIRDAGHGKAELKCFVSIVDLHTGIVQSVSAGCPVPLVHRLEFGGRPDNVQERFFQITDQIEPALGTVENYVAKTQFLQLRPLDLILARTSGAPWTRATEATVVSKLYDDYGTKQGQAVKICEGIMKELPKATDGRDGIADDDVTIVVMTVPKDAYFIERVQEKKDEKKDEKKSAA